MCAQTMCLFLRDWYVLTENESKYMECICNENSHFVAEAKVEQKAEEVKPEVEKPCANGICELDLGRFFKKAKTGKGDCNITEYMDSISRTGASLLSTQKDAEFNENLPRSGLWSLDSILKWHHFYRAQWKS